MHTIYIVYVYCIIIVLWCTAHTTTWHIVDS
jgi:hypothetical protein